MDAPQLVFEVTPESFQADVVERSAQTPIVLLFWAAQMEPAAAARGQLEALVPRYQGKVLLGLVDVAVDQALAQHLRVQALPSIRVVSNGQIVSQMDGPQPDAVLTDLLDGLTLSPADVLRSQLGVLLEQREFDQAMALLQQAIHEEPNNQAFRVELADVLLRRAAGGDDKLLAEAQQVLAGIPEETPERGRPAARAELLAEAAGFEPVAALEARLTENEDDLEARYQLAVRLATLDRFEPALEHALTVLQKDRKFRDDIGRLTMIRIFDVLGKGAPLAGTYRRRMFNFLH
ncbi:MAG: tetratricopeptide repeat protein [Pseudomonadota bacterium]